MPDTYRITNYYRSEAQKIAKQRRQHHIDRGTYTGTDDKKDWLDGEIYGALFELFWEWLLKQKNIPYTPAPAYEEDTSQLPEWDFEMDGYHIELKTIPPGDNKIRFMVNVDSTIIKGGEKIGQRKDVDYYICAKMYDDHFELMGAATSQQVDNMWVDDFGEGDAYHCFMHKMPLTMDEFWHKIGKPSS